MKMSNVPSDLSYVSSHEWIRLEDDGTVTVGITDHAQELLGDVVYVELPEIDSEVAMDDEIAVVESVKAASDIFAPISGTIIEINEALEALKKLSSPRALVIRDGIEIRIPGREIVTDDLLILNEGDRIAADAVLAESINLMIDESMLTGESIPVLKKVLKKKKVKMLMIGDGPERYKAEELCRKDNLCDKVLFLGKPIVSPR